MQQKLLWLLPLHELEQEAGVHSALQVLVREQPTFIILSTKNGFIAKKAWN